MAGDTFDAEKVAAQVQKAAEGMNKFKGTTQQVAKAMKDLGQASAVLPELSKVLDPKQFKEVKDSIKEIEKALINEGKTVQDLVDIRKKEKILIGAELVDMEKLTRAGKKRVAEEKKRLDFGKKFIEVEGELVRLSHDEVKSTEKAVSAFGKKGWQGAKYAASMAGVQLSLAGIIALIIKSIDYSNRFGAMSQQIAAQWGESERNLEAASGEIGKIQFNFQQLLDTAGPYAISLARAGFEKENLKELSQDLLATEFRTGQSVEEQANYIKGLVSNFGLADVEANTYLNTVREATKTIPMLSMTEAVQDWGELIDKTKTYNTDLLGTLAMYNALMREDLAEKLGLGDAPRAVRKEIVKTVAGFSAELEDGWKAALGEGATAASKIINFEAMDMTDQFARMADFIMEKTSGLVGDNQKIGVRELLKQFGFTSKEVQKVMADAFTTGGLNAQGLKSLMKETGGLREEMEKSKEEAKKNRQELISKGMAIADGLSGLLHDLQVKMQKVYRWIADLIDSIQDLVSAIQNFSLFGSGSWPTGSPEEIMGRAMGKRIKQAPSPTKRLSQISGGGGTGSELTQHYIRSLVADPTVAAPMRKFAEGSGVLSALQRKDPKAYETMVSDILLRAMDIKELKDFQQIIAKKQSNAAITAFTRELKNAKNIEAAVKDITSRYQVVGGTVIRQYGEGRIF